ncbi:MAG: ABC transporter substrate-binding protein [Bacteroidetes bacterium]|nr:ABC transporter substrate-binding protein [Bacteroidota bacterium]
MTRLSQKRDLAIISSLAESWEIDTSLTLYTFYLQKGVKFHDDPCFSSAEQRNVTAHNFKYCFDKLCESSPENKGFWVFKDKVKGANEYYQSSLDGNLLEGGVSGVTVIDDYTLTIELEQPFANFLYILAMPFTNLFPKEALDMYGSGLRTYCVGTGAFELNQVKEDEAVILVRNEDYWGTDQYGNSLPYLDGIKVSFIKEKKSELFEFNKGNLDMVYKLPIEMLDEILDDNENTKGSYKQYQLQITPALAIQYYGFQHQSEIFKDKKVRQAFNYAIDRRKLVDFTMKGAGIKGIYGVVPPAVPFYDSKSVKGYQFDPNKAARLLAEAGYPDGKDFPEFTLQINSGGGRNIQVAEAILKMLEENLNISAQMTVLPWGQLLENLESGKAAFWRISWVADYPDPENFLNLFYSVYIPKKEGEKSYLNTTRYESQVFDSLFTLAMRTENEDERFKIYLQADSVVINDAAILPLYYDKYYRLLQGYVQDLYQNAMELRDFRKVYFAEPVTEEGEEELASE